MRILAFLILILSHAIVFGQKPVVKYGDVSKENLLLEDCSFEPGAPAMVLAKSGELKFGYDNDKGWQYEMEVIVRMKVFTSEGKDEGNVKIRLYQPEEGGYRESINSLKATTYNLENGKVVKTKLSGSDKYLNRINDWYMEYSFAMPNLKEGSVFEYKYVQVSDYMDNLSEWYFQDEIPIRYNEFKYVIPEYFNYRSMVNGTVLDLEETVNRASQTFTIVNEYIDPKAMQNASMTGKASAKVTNEYTLDPYCTSTRYVARDVPSVIDEPFMSNKVDMPSRIEFQLVSVQFPRSAEQQIATDYAVFSDKLLKRDDFGMRIGNALYAKELVEKTEGKDDRTKAQIILRGVKNQIKWNGVYGFTSRKAGRMAYNKEEGEIADLNLTLVAILREAGLEAYPVILSTRGHGQVHPVYPYWADFNYVIAAVVLDNKIELADASGDFGIGYLPSRCFNGKGWLVDRQLGQWVDLKTNSQAKTSSMTELSIADTKIKGTCSVKGEIYSGYSMMNRLKEDGEEEFINDIREQFAEYEVPKIEWGKDNSIGDFRYSFDLSADLDDSDIIYIQPFSDVAMLENPFKREERMAPIDFMYAYSDKAVTILEIPDGYVAELPEQIKFKLPDGGLSFNYQVLDQGNRLTIISYFKVKRSDYTSEEYGEVKNFFEEMVKMNNQMVVLKRS